MVDESIPRRRKGALPRWVVPVWRGGARERAYERTISFRRFDAELRAICTCRPRTSNRQAVIKTDPTDRSVETPIREVLLRSSWLIV